MAFVVQPCFPADAPGLATTMMGARLTDPHWSQMWEDPSSKTIISNAIDRVPWNLVTGRNTKRHQKAIDLETGRVVGYARWFLPPDLTKKGDVWLEAQVAEGKPAERAIFEKRYQGSTKNGRLVGIKSGEMMSYRSAPLEAADARIMQDGPFLTLDYLTTDPSFWRIKTYVMSEPAALKLYLNHGFELVDTVSTDYSKYGGTEPMVHHFLVREPPRND